MGVTEGFCVDTAVLALVPGLPPNTPFTPTFYAIGMSIDITLPPRIQQLSHTYACECESCLGLGFYALLECEHIEDLEEATEKGKTEPFRAPKCFFCIHICALLFFSLPAARPT